VVFRSSTLARLITRHIIFLVRWSARRCCLCVRVRVFVSLCVRVRVCVRACVGELLIAAAIV